jgi:hypothetical protein
MPLAKETRHGTHDGHQSPRLSDALSALIAAADPSKPPSEDEILALILDELGSQDSGTRRRGKA